MLLILIKQLEVKILRFFTTYDILTAMVTQSDAYILRSGDFFLWTTMTDGQTNHFTLVHACRVTNLNLRPCHSDFGSMKMQ